VSSAGASSGFRRIAALLVAALLVVVPAGWIAWSSLEAARLAETIQTQTALAASLRTRIAGLEPAATAPEEAAPDVFLPGATPALAGAALQTTVARTIEGAGGRLIETEMARVEEAEADPGRLDLRVAFDAEIVSLQRILFELETGVPVLFVRSLEIQTAAEASEAPSPPLRVSMLVGGYLETTN